MTKKTTDNIADFDVKTLIELTPEKLKTHIAQVPLNLLKKIVEQLIPKKNSQWKPKLKAIIEGVKENEALEGIGKALNVPQFQEVLEMYATEKVDIFKIFSILVGLNSEVFTAALSELTEQQLHVLQIESSTEPVQHLLLKLCHEFSSLLTIYDSEAHGMKKDIENMDLRDLGASDLKIIMDDISAMAEKYKDLLTDINPALAIAWNSGRSDLIDQLSALKEHCQHSLKNYVGVGNDEWDNELHAILAQRLNAPYGDPDNPFDIEALHDDEPAIEVLTKFGMWYPRDFFEIGLLPHIKAEKDLELDSKKHTDIQRAEHRDVLLNMVRLNLEKLGFVTVKDLREAGIFSKKSLAEYIQAKRLKK